MSSVPGSRILTGLGTTVVVVFLALVLFGPPGMAVDFVMWLGGKIGAVVSDLLNRLPQSDTTSALGGPR